MPTAISNKALLEKCRRWTLSDFTQDEMDDQLKDAIIRANRQICRLDGTTPLAWNRATYDELFTRYSAVISAVTQANPGVVTAESNDPDLSDNHGFQTDDIAYVQGMAGMTRLNNRFFRVEKVTDTTLKLKTLDGQTTVNTTNYEEYDDGGGIYHAGIVLPASTIEPTDSWTIHRVYGAQFDLRGTDPITEEKVNDTLSWLEPGGQPEKHRYQKQSYSSFSGSGLEHLLFWYKFPAQRYNIRLLIEKGYPDIANWDESHYPPHPVEIHDFVWVRALSILATANEKARRQTKERMMGMIEVRNADHWIQQALEDEVEILQISRSMLGDEPKVSGGMGA